MFLILTFNILILAGLAIFFLREELRFRALVKHIAKTKNDLTSIVHQLRSPLSNLRKYNEFLQSKEFGNLSFAQHEAISKVQSSLVESLVLLDRLLARSRLDEGKVALQAAQLNLREIVDGACNAVMASPQDKKYSLSVQGKNNVQIFVDPILLHGILDEIVTNAIHYTPDGGKITVKVSDDTTSATIAVTDTGIGISEAERPHIFEKFFRGERARSMHAGNGLGLSFAKEFTSKLQGTIRFTSAEKKGTTFTVSLPKKTKRA